MQIIIDIVVAGLMAYLSFTNMLAEHVNTFLGQEIPETSDIIIEEEPMDEASIELPIEDTALTPLESIFSFIRDILLKNVDYQ